MTDTESNMAKELDMWVDEGRISGWDGLTTEVRTDGSVVVLFNVHLNPGISFDLRGIRILEGMRCHQSRELSLAG